MASYAAAIKRQFEVEPDTKTGRRGQFDVLVNGKAVIGRKGGLIAMLAKKPWPTEAEIVSAVKAELESGAA